MRSGSSARSCSPTRSCRRRSTRGKTHSRPCSASSGFSDAGNGRVMRVRQDVIGGRYELKHVVGSGGMSTVYCAFDTLLERNVALKILHDQYGEDQDYV